MDWTVPVSPFLLHFLPFLLPFPPPVLGEGERWGQGWINMHAGGKMGVGITGRGPSGISKGGAGGAKPRPPLHLLHTHTKQKIWIHQNLLGHGCSNSPQAARLGSSSSDPAIFLWFLHGCQITLPPPQELRFVSVCWCMCDLAYEHRAMGHYTSTGPDRTAQKRLRRGEAAAMFFQF